MFASVGGIRGSSESGGVRSQVNYAVSGMTKNAAIEYGQYNLSIKRFPLPLQGQFRLRWLSVPLNKIGGEQGWEEKPAKKFVIRLTPSKRRF